MSIKTTFTKDFDHRTERGAIIAYKAGWSGSIPQAHHDAAAAAGVIGPTNGKGDGA